MATSIGTEKNFIDSLKNLISLDFDLAEAYGAAIKRLDKTQFQDKLSTFKEDYARHIRKLTGIVIECGMCAPYGTDMKSWLTKGKIILAGLIGDKAILQAMLSNEEEINKAYENVYNRNDKIKESELILKEALDDGKKHYMWLESTIKGLIG